jgi:hypothetical protein
VKNTFRILVLILISSDFLGWTKHKDINQQFIFTPLGHGGGFAVQSAWNGNYATVEEGICTGIPVVANAFPAAWVLEECPQWLRGKRISDGLTPCFRIRWPNSRFVIDLEGYGCAKNGTKVNARVLFCESPTTTMNL